jgi:cell wall-associated NlpC family hydrolase
MWGRYKEDMEFPAKRAQLLVLFCLVAFLAASGEEKRVATDGSDGAPRENAAMQQKLNRTRPLTRAEGRRIVQVAMDSRHPVKTRYDCSHFVHGSYQRAGFPYTYASSSDLYEGDAKFLRVSNPQPGDLAVWPGHAGIVVNPARRSFLSVLHNGPGVDRYDSKYWRRRGQPRFFRYVKATPEKTLSSSVRNASSR